LPEEEFSSKKTQHSSSGEERSFSKEERSTSEEESRVSEREICSPGEFDPPGQAGSYLSKPQILNGLAIHPRVRTGHPSNVDKKIRYG
jgi:hypothetical protein